MANKLAELKVALEGTSDKGIMDAFRPGSLEDIFRSGSLELPEKAVDELVELMRSRPRSLEFRSGSLELPEKAVDELVELMRSSYQPWPNRGSHSLPRSLMLEKPSRPFQPLLSTQEVADAYITHKEDGGAAEGYTKVRARKLRFFARQHPKLPTDREPIRAYLRQFKTADVPTRQDQWKALFDLYKYASGEYHIPNPMLEVDKPHFKKKPGKRLSRDEAKRFIAAINSGLEWALVTCYFGLRLRRIEAERLLSGEIKSDYITVTNGKERGEELPLLSIFREMLLRVETHGPNGRHFPIKADTMAHWADRQTCWANGYPTHAEKYSCGTVVLLRWG